MTAGLPRPGTVFGQFQYLSPPVRGARQPTALVLVATLSAHDPAAFDEHVPAGLGGVLLPGRWSAGWRAAWVAGCVEEACERRDGLEQQGVDAGLLVGGVPGAELGDGAAVVVLGGELADAGCDGGGHVRARAGWRGGVGRG